RGKVSRRSPVSRDARVCGGGEGELRAFAALNFVRGFAALCARLTPLPVAGDQCFIAWTPLAAIRKRPPRRKARVTGSGEAAYKERRNAAHEERRGRALIPNTTP